MKKGFFVIIEKNGQYIAAIRRADKNLIELDLLVTDAIRALDGKPCEYLLNKGERIVRVDGQNIFKQPKQEQFIQNNIREREPLQRAVNIADSFSINHLRVPSDTKQNCERSGGDNFALKLNKFGRFDFKKDEGDKHFKFYNAQPVTVGKAPDKRTIVPIISIRSNFGKLFPIEKSNQIAERLQLSAKSIFSASGQLLCFSFHPEWRFVTGLGGHSIYETGITLHHVYGIPYIPASSIKGVLRSWIVKSHPFFNNNEGLAIRNQEFCEVFGCPAEMIVEIENDQKRPYKSVFEEARQGKITFLDAFPTHKPTIEVDVMNPHYPKYYGGKGAPVDTDSPNPIFFLTVAKTTFQFLMATKVDGWNLTTKLFLGKTLADWLKEALEEHGLGAKTAVGYGYFKETS